MNLKRHRNLLICMIDVLILMIVCSVLFYIFPQTSGMADKNILSLLPHLLLLVICETIPQYLCKTYNRLWRYAESREYLLMFTGGFAGYLLFLIFDHLIFLRQLLIQFSLMVCSISLLGMIILRLGYRHYQREKRNRAGRCCKSIKDMIPLAIIGAGEAGIKLHEELAGNPDSRYQTMYFVDDSADKIGKSVRGIPVKGPIAALNQILLENHVNEVVITTENLTHDRQKLILDTCLNQKCKVQILPNTLDLLKAGHNTNLWKNVREINLEELLGREPVKLDKKVTESCIRHKTVLVTGGAGSIGSELCRQIAKLKPKKLIILDIYENSAYEIQQELSQLYKNKLNLIVEIASITDKEAIFRIFRQYQPNIVFHAAAHKHVPLMEDCPEEAVRNNIFGTYHLVLAAEKYKVRKFILISTDKAVNPTSIMGASKRFCEMILQSRRGHSSTEFVAVRFGNVLGSNGSVILLFKKQIVSGGPITITDKRITRFFMTISEAVQLVLQAAAMANSNEIYVLDMGEPVKIIDLAENLIRLSGYIPYTEIPIEEVGLRPGEKLYEELLTNSENLVATPNQKIFIERQSHISKWEMHRKLRLLKCSLDTHSPEKIKETLKKVVTTYHDPTEVNMP